MLAKMKLSRFWFLCLTALLISGCSVSRSVYKRFPLPKGTDEPTAQRVFAGVVQAMRSQPFVDEIRKRFPQITQQQLLKTDIRFEWFATSGERTYSVAFGVKDISAFPDADSLIDFALEYGKAEAQKLLPRSNGKTG